MWHYLFYLAYNYQSKKDWICIILSILLKPYPIQECGLQYVFTDSESLDSVSCESKVLRIPESITDFTCVCPCQCCTESVQMRQGVSTPPLTGPQSLSNSCPTIVIWKPRMAVPAVRMCWIYLPLALSHDQYNSCSVMLCELCLAMCPFFKVHRGYMTHVHLLVLLGCGHLFIKVGV